MRILIGVPTHINEDKKVRTILKNISILRRPALVLLVDSSPDRKYTKRIKNYCKEYGIRDYKITHFSYHQPNGIDERVGRSREIIRKYVISNNYDSLLYWENDSKLQKDGLENMIAIMKAGNYMIVSHNPLAKKISRENNHPLSCDLISREPLRRYGFLLDYPDMPQTWYHNGVWFKKRIMRDGGKYVELNISIPKQTRRFKDETSLKLNLGCGKKLLDGYMNIDIQPPYDLKHDLRAPLPFKDNSIDEIYSEGSVITLLSRSEWKDMKRDLFRVLKPGGKIELILVDLEYVMRAFLENKYKRRQWWHEMIFAGQHNKYEFAKNGFTYDMLVSDLKQEGFSNFRKDKPPEKCQMRLVCFKKHEEV